MPIILSSESTAEILEIDAAGSNADGTDPGSPLVISGGNYGLLAHAYPSPPLDVFYASSIDTEGERDVSRRYRNRTIQIELDVAGAALYDLQAKVAKLQREGGTLKRTLKDGTTIRIYDLIAADDWSPEFTDLHYLGDVTKVMLNLPARPLARGEEATLADHVETTLPVLVATDSGIAGDVTAAPAALTFDNDSTVDFAAVSVRGWRPTRSTRTLHPRARARCSTKRRRARLLVGRRRTRGPAGAGAGSSVMRSAALSSTSYTAILSTQATGGGAHMSHIGTFRVYARLQTPTTNVSYTDVGLEWSTGDYRRFERNTAVRLTAAHRGTWRVADLGLVHAAAIPQGTQRWEGRIIAKGASTSTANTVDVDWLMLVPVDQGFGFASGLWSIPTPTTYSARDEFDQTAGALTGKSLTLGGTWAGAGDADDFQVTGTGAVTRTAVSDASSTTGRYATASTPTLSTAMASVLFKTSTAGALSITPGLLLRYVDVNNWALFRLVFGIPTVTKRVAGTVTDIATATDAPQLIADNYSAGTYLKLGFLAAADGTFAAWVVNQNDTFKTPTLTGRDSVLATGGTLDDGKVGFYDSNADASAATRTFDAFTAWVPVLDAAAFAGQSIAFTDVDTIREDSAGAYWTRTSIYKGSRLKLPPAGQEGRSARWIVKPLLASEDPDRGTWLDDSIPDLSGRISYTARYIS